MFCLALYCTFFLIHKELKMVFWIKKGFGFRIFLILNGYHLTQVNSVKLFTVLNDIYDDP